MTTLDPLLLLQGYATGIFPMADSRDAEDVYWIEPRERAVLPLDGFHLSRSLAKRLRSGRFSVTCNRDFAAVIRGCADREETWINRPIERAVLALHEKGFAHSIEVWSRNELVGGIYGVALQRAFFGESMFSRATDASKVALAWLVARLKVGGFTLLDCQFITDHLASLGAITASRKAYVALLSAALGSDVSGSGPGSAGVAPEEAGAFSPTLRVRGVARAEFGALDRLLESSGAADDPGASGKFITQLLGHTS